MKRATVLALEWLCGQLDRIPTWERDEDGTLVRCCGAFGCGWLGLAAHAVALDERWQTDVWQDVK